MADPFPELEGVLFLNAGLRREAEARVLVRRAEQLALQDAEGQAAAQAEAERAEKARKLEEKRMQAEQKFRDRAAKVAAEADAEAIERQSALAGRRELEKTKAEEEKQLKAMIAERVAKEKLAQKEAKKAEQAAAKARKQQEKQMKLQQKIQQCQQAEVEADKRAQKLRSGNESAAEQGPAVTAATAPPKRTPFNVNPSNPDSKAPESHYEVMTREQAAQVTHQRLAQSNTRLDEIRRSIEASRKLLAEAEAATRLLASQEEEAVATAAASAAANSATKGDGSGGEVAVKASSKIRAGIAAPSIASNKVRAGFTPSMASDKNRAEIAARRKEELASLQKDQEAKVREAVSERDRKTKDYNFKLQQEKLDIAAAQQAEVDALKKLEAERRERQRLAQEAAEEARRELAEQVAMQQEEEQYQKEEEQRNTELLHVVVDSTGVNVVGGGARKPQEIEEEGRKKVEKHLQALRERRARLVSERAKRAAADAAK